MAASTSKSSLLKFREWLTVAETANHLALMFGEPVTEADVLRLGLDGRLRLSVRLIRDTYIQPFRPMTEDEANAVQEQFDKRVADVRAAAEAGVEPPRANIVYPDVGSVMRTGSESIFDLPLLLSERWYVEQQYQRLVNGPDDVVGDRGLFCVERAAKQWIIVQRKPDTDINPTLPYTHPDNYSPTLDLPSGTAIVVRTSALRELESSTGERGRPDDDDRALDTRERRTLLILLAAAARRGVLDLSKPGTAAVLEQETALMGTRISENTIRTVLKQIPGAIASRKK